MADPSSTLSSFDSVEKVRILMHEYNGLRLELLHRVNNAFQLFTASGAIVVWLLSRAAETITEGIPVWKDWPFGICIVLALVALGAGVRFIFRRINKAKSRLRVIVKTVNDLTGQPDLLNTPA